MLGLTVATLISRAITLLIAFTLHELAHALTADYLGDRTPRMMGRITLNPIAHLDPIGTILLLVAGFGWAKPVQVNPYNLRNGPRLGMAVVAAAGPLANLGMAVLGGIPLRLGLLGASFSRSQLVPTPFEFMYDFVLINLLLMLFNLLPIGPLDGSKILRGFAPHEWDSFLVPLEQWGFFILMLLVFVGGPILSIVIGQPAGYLFRAITGLG
jgi:Zn-dependent protease